MTHATGDLTAPAPTPVVRALDVQEAAPTPAPPLSPLGDLRRKRQTIAEKLHLDLRVPGWGDDPDEDPRVSIYCRYRPLRPSEMNTIQEKRSKTTRANGGKNSTDWVDLGNADVLVVACTEVWAQIGEPRDLVDIDEDARLSLSPDEGIHGPKTRFDGRLADALGMPRNTDGTPPTPVQVVRHLYLHDGNIAYAVTRLTRWSNLRVPENDEDFTAG